MLFGYDTTNQNRNPSIRSIKYFKISLNRVLQERCNNIGFLSEAPGISKK